MILDLMSHPQSRAERNPRAQPVPSGQNGWRRESPTMVLSSGCPFRTFTRAATRAAYRLVKSKMQQSGEPDSPENK